MTQTKRLRNWRIWIRYEAGETVQKIADDLGLSRGRVSVILRGERQRKARKGESK